MFYEGRQIGSYTLLHKLGKGGFGEVWLAEKRSQFVTKRVAVKLPLDDQVNFEAIRQEATLWEQASGHANVLPIIDADVYDGQVVIVSEYADGGSLHDKLKTEGKLPIKQAVEMTIGILNGLEFLHNKQIIHRDIKPQNILLQGETPRLADFGISRAMQTTAISSTIIGTDAYMSPESFTGKRSVQADIWSVGVVFYQLLKGELPFQQEHPSERMYAILQRDFEPLPANIPQSLKTIIAKALAKLPENRYKTAIEMREDLHKVLRGKNVPPQNSPETETVIKPKPSPKSEQPQSVPSKHNVYKIQSDLATFIESKTAEKTETKHYPLVSFVKLFIVALIIVGGLFLLMNVKYFENYFGRTNSSPEYVPDSPRNTITSSVTPNKEIPSPIPRKKRKSNNANVMYANTNNIQETTQSQESSEKFNPQEQALREQNTFQNLQNAMSQTAQKTSLSRHQSSNLQQCYGSVSNFVAGQTQYENSYNCRLKGKIFGIRNFEVSVKVRGEITRQGNDFIGRIVNYEILSDREF